MSQDILNQLNSNNPVKRRAAIMALGRSKDPRALPYLAHVYENDPLPELRQLAMQAGQHIQRAAGSGGGDAARAAYVPGDSSGGGMSYADSLAADQPAAAQEVEVPEADQQRAKSRLDYAIGYSVKGETDRAAKELARALQLNPNLRRDQMALGLAQSITGLDPNQAIEVIANPRARGSFQYQSTGGGDARLQITPRRRSTGSDATTLNVLLDTVYYFLTATGVVVAPFIAVLIRLAGLFVVAFGSLLVQFVVLPSLIGALISTMVIAIVTITMFYLGKLFGGKARFAQFYHAIVPTFTWVTLVSAVIQVLLVFLFIESVAENPEVLSFVSLMTTVAMLYFVFVQVAATHEIGLGATLATVIIAGVILVAVAVVAIAVGLSLAFGSLGGLGGLGGEIAF